MKAIGIDDSNGFFCIGTCPNPSHLTAYPNTANIFYNER